MRYPMRAKFGLSLSTRAVLFGWGTLDDLLTAAQTAEASGYFDGVWVGDNLLSKPRAEALVTLSAIAARTQQVLDQATRGTRHRKPPQISMEATSTRKRSGYPQAAQMPSAAGLKSSTTPRPTKVEANIMLPTLIATALNLLMSLPLSTPGLTSRRLCRRPASP